MPSGQTPLHVQITTFRSPANRSLALLASALLLAGAAAPTAYNADAASPASADKPAPLPLHQIEGSGGIFATQSAYIVNPPRNGEPVGRPSVGFAYVHLGHGRALAAYTLTETPLPGLELGFAYDDFDLGDLPEAIEAATGVRLRDDSVSLHNLNARFQFLKESDSAPAVTIGAHYKANDGIARIDDDLGGALQSIGVTHKSGVDFTLYASKLFAKLPRPLLINAGLRATKGAHVGLLGFTDDYDLVFEGNAVLFVTGSFALAAEYRQKPRAYAPIGTLVQPEDDWWTLDAAYVFDRHFTIAAGYGHFGRVLNHTANGVWGVTAKFEF